MWGWFSKGTSSWTMWQLLSGWSSSCQDVKSLSITPVGVCSAFSHMETRQRRRLDGNRFGRLKVPLVSCIGKVFRRAELPREALSTKGKIGIGQWVCLITCGEKRKIILGFFIPYTPRLALIFEIRGVLKLCGSSVIVLIEVFLFFKDSFCF